MRSSQMSLVLSLITIGCALEPGSEADTLGEEPRRELYQATTRFELRAARADVYSINLGDVAQRDDGDWDLLSVPFTIYEEGPVGRNLCPDASFYGQPRLYWGATAILVGDDLAVTAGHAMQNAAACANRALIIDHAVPLPDGSSETVHPIIPAENFFFCKELVATGYPAQDWSLIRLDRSVAADRIPLKVRREGSLPAGTPTLLVGHPHRLPLKLEATTGTGGPYSVYGPGNISFGSSGSMVLNALTNRVEGLVVSGSIPPPTYDPAGDCYRECVTCGGTYSATLAARFADVVPRIGLEVSPAEVISHYGPPGGPFTNARVDYTLSAGRTGRPTRFVLGTTDSLIFFEPSADRPVLPPGTSRAAPAFLDLHRAGGLPVGVYERVVSFDDRTYFTQDERLHRVVVGVDGFEVTHETLDGLVFYSFLNRYEVSQSIAISADVEWIAPDATEVILPSNTVRVRSPVVTVSLASEPVPYSEAAITFSSGWHTETRHVVWDGYRLVALD
jgi:hypothetical protein